MNRPLVERGTGYILGTFCCNTGQSLKPPLIFTEAQNAERKAKCLTFGRGGNQRRVPPEYVENTFKAIQSTFRSLEMHSKRRYKICNCSFILGELNSFRNCKGFSIIFSKSLGAIKRFTKVRIFSDSSLHHILESEILGFLFLSKIV